MADFTEIIQEINTNLPDNNTQSITAAKLRDTLIDLTNTIENQQDGFETDLQNQLDTFEGQIDSTLGNLIVDNLTSSSTTNALSANQGRILDEKITQLPNVLSNPITTSVDFTSASLDTMNFVIGVSTLNWSNSTNAKCAIIPVYAGEKLFIESTNNSCHYGFLSSYPTPVVGESANLIGDTLYYLNTTSTPETSRTQIVPQNAQYIYVKMKEGNTTYTPSTLTITGERFITDTDIVNNLESTDSSKVLSAAIGPQIDKLEKSISKENIISIFRCNQVSFVIGVSTLNWISTDGARCAIVPVTPGEKIYVKAMPGASTHIGFWENYPEPVAGESANLIDGLKYTGVSSHPALDETYTVPSNAHYMYVKMLEGSLAYTPEVLKRITDEAVVIDSYYPVDIYEDTYIEEDIVAYNTKLSTGVRRTKLYKIDPTINYKVIIYVYASSSSTANQIRFYDSNMNLLGGDYPISTSSYWAKMEDVTLPENTAYVKLYGYIGSAGSGYTNKGCFALMKPLKKDGSMPKNSNVYCVSKIKYPTMPWNYSEADTTFPQTDIWSAWSFMFPYSANSITGKEFPLVSFFHGSRGFLTSEYMGYNSAATSTGIVGALRNKGCVVFDINGWGISQESDQYSRHWGNPIAVETVKKAYEVLTTRFNCRKGMVISGISMGGAISKSYCMIHPEDVIACALEAPSDMGCTSRIMTWDGEVATAWGGYDSAQALTDDVNRDRFIGYSPTLKPMVIQDDGTITFMQNVMDWKSVYNPSASGYNDANNLLNPTNIGRFYNPFPVEIKIWHGDADTNVSLKYNQYFVNTVRNANCNATLRLCPDCVHDLNTYPWVMDEVVNYIVDKLNI